MNSQVYTAASGLIIERQRLDLIANNLANLSTPGYRAQRLFTMPSERAANRLAPPSLALPTVLHAMPPWLHTVISS